MTPSRVSAGDLREQLVVSERVAQSCDNGRLEVVMT